jgi:hypothetical protein
MQRLRLLAPSLLASACVLSAAAQSPALSPPPAWYSSSTLTTLDDQPPSAPLALATQTPPPSFSATIPPSAHQPVKSSSFHVDIAPDSNWLTPIPATQASEVRVQPQDRHLLAQWKAQGALKKHEDLLAQTTVPCYTLRVYGFTARDLKSPHPHSSTETDCTPASSAHLKALQLPATINTK